MIFKKYYLNILIANLLSISCNFYPFGSYGFLEIAIFLPTPKYSDFDALLNAIKVQENSLQTKILSLIAEKKDLHMSLTYPLIPLDEEVIKLFPRIQHVTEKLPIDQRAESYRKKIPTALSKWLKPRVARWFVSAEQWSHPISLPFLALHQLGKFLAAEFSLDKQGRLLYIIDVIKKKLTDQFSKTKFAFDSTIPHLSLGILNPLFDLNSLVQPSQSIAGLTISKSSARDIVVSIRIKKDLFQKPGI